MNVELLHHTPLKVAIRAARTCYDSHNRSDYVDEQNIGGKNEQLLRKLIKLGHTSVIEHLVYTFEVTHLSRLALQELVRHRIASYSVKSTRWTLKRVVKELDHGCNKSLLEKFLVLPKFAESFEDIYCIILQRLATFKDWASDQLKYILPENWATDLVITMNARSLRNFFALRTDPAAHFEIRELALKMFDVLPDTHKFLFEDVVHKGG